ncbi:hypothetical protein HPO96_17430 [Kribbella sandramycini]|uniref:Uncharacterized protein n=1 Tax=Kribbella sandramycini TaxID=60450 RepID=A0A7Y4L0G3_9ACTN|nr:hypothetical protein [Kribbella sandramycini]MBB6565768.1 hypothetical protein [Kribbella sandramycini]NOL42030.1 hypothetical protein [Kribbella sandramycini]
MDQTKPHGGEQIATEAEHNVSNDKNKTYLVWRNGKAEDVSYAEWQKCIQATNAKWDVIEAAESVVNEAAKKWWRR